MKLLKVRKSSDRGPLLILRIGSNKVDQETLIECEKTTPDDKAAHDSALVEQYRISRSEGIDAVLEKYGVNVLVVPSEAKKATRYAAMAGKSTPPAEPEFCTY